MNGTGSLIIAAVLAAAVCGWTPAAEAAPVNVNCTPSQVGTASNRVFVRCSAAASGGVVYFAFATTDAPAAARVLSVLSTAHVAGRTLGISYEPGDTSGTSFGCQANDCRLILSVWFNN